MRVVFRVDASSAIGTGHLFRCVVLADYLRSKGSDVAFICRLLEGNLCRFLESSDFKVWELANSTDYLGLENGKETTGSYPSIDTAADALDSYNVISDQQRFDWLVIDHYGLDVEWENRLRPHVGRLMVIDDFPNRRHNCDLLLNQNFLPNIESQIYSVGPTCARQLLGPKYALLQPLYCRLHKELHRTNKNVQKIFAFFGGSDERNVTAVFLRAFDALNNDHLLLDVVVGVNHPDKEDVYLQCENKPNICVHHKVSSLAPLILAADLGVGTCGTTTWERCALGLPSLVVTAAENEKHIASELDNAGLVYWIGEAGQVTEELFLKQLNKLIDSFPLSEMGDRCRKLVDGQGVMRVCASMESSSEMALKVRFATLTDEDVYYEWANDTAVRENSFCSRHISQDEHHKWFESRIANDEVILCIIDSTDGVPIGQARFENDCGTWSFHYSIDSAFRGIGLGSRLVEHALDHFFKHVGSDKIVAEVKKANVRSCRIFGKLGFKQREGKTNSTVQFWYGKIL